MNIAKVNEDVERGGKAAEQGQNEFFKNTG